MTTLVIRLSELMAKRLAQVADRPPRANHEDVALVAINQYLDRELGKVRGRKVQSKERKK